MRKLKIPGRVIGHKHILARIISTDTSLPSGLDRDAKQTHIGFMPPITTLQYLTNYLNLKHKLYDEDELADGRDRAGLPLKNEAPESLIRYTLLQKCLQTVGILANGQMTPLNRCWPWHTAPLRDKN